MSIEQENVYKMSKVFFRNEEERKSVTKRVEEKIAVAKSKQLVKKHYKLRAKGPKTDVFSVFYHSLERK